MGPKIKVARACNGNIKASCFENYFSSFKHLSIYGYPNRCVNQSVLYPFHLVSDFGTEFILEPKMAFQ